MALRQDTVRLLIADDVGIGKTVEAGLIAAELLAQGDATRPGRAVLARAGRAVAGASCATSSASTPSWCSPRTVTRLERGLRQGESLFDRYPHVVVSTDFIKSTGAATTSCARLPGPGHRRRGAHLRRRDGTGGRARTQRYELVPGLAADAERHLILVTATPHCGKEEPFRNLIGLLQPEPRHTSTSTRTRAGELLARHFVQRRRADIRDYLDEDTPFPEDRQTQERSYALARPYRELFDDVLAVRPRDGPRPRRRPAAAAGPAGGPRSRCCARWPPRRAPRPPTLRTRAANRDAAATRPKPTGSAAPPCSTWPTTRPSRPPTPRPAPTATPPTARRRTAGGCAASRPAPASSRASGDDKLKLLGETVKELLPTATTRSSSAGSSTPPTTSPSTWPQRLGADYAVAAVTGALPPDERRSRIGELASDPGKRPVLVATDCLSEGVNLQEHFQAVVHYDLAWNPTRHEQREGRVDRFGQRPRIVRAVTLYGADNGIDGIVLDVLIRKHEQIRKATGHLRPGPRPQRRRGRRRIVEGLLLRDAARRAARVRGHRPGRTRPTCTASGTAPSATGTPVPHPVPPGRHPARRGRPRGRRDARRPRHRRRGRATSPARRCARCAPTSPRCRTDSRASTGPLPAGLRDALVPGHARAAAVPPRPPGAARRGVPGPDRPERRRGRPLRPGSRARPAWPRRPCARPGGAASCAPPRCPGGPRCCWSGYRFHLELPGRDGRAPAGRRGRPGPRLPGPRRQRRLAHPGRGTGPAHRAAGRQHPARSGRGLRRTSRRRCGRPPLTPR